MASFLDNTTTIQPASTTCRTLVETGVLANLPAYLQMYGLALNNRIFIIVDENVRHHYGEALSTPLKLAGIDQHEFSVPSGEQHKNQAEADRLYNVLGRYGAGRQDTIVVIGGGVTGDLGGFVAATYMRGLRFIQIPTTLLAMVDASIGGKTAINVYTKNQAGRFHFPQLVLIDPAFLGTLEPRVYTEGWGEIIKTGVLSPELLPVLEENAEFLSRFSPDALDLLGEIIAHCAAYKTDVVRRDPEELEPDVRAVLNYGHTFGHAVERLDGFTGLLHGEAVAIGMQFALLLAQEVDVLRDPGLPARQTALLEAFGLPTRYQGRATDDQIVDGLLGDKKNTGDGRVRFVLPVEAGNLVPCKVDTVFLTQVVRKFLAQ